MSERGAALNAAGASSQNGLRDAEGHPIHGTGVIFELPDNRYLFFRRHNNPDIPYPGRIALIGGRCLPDEPGKTAARREVSEEIFYKDTNAPLLLDEDGLAHVATIPDARPGVIDVFRYRLDIDADKVLDVLGIREDEGDGLVVLSGETLLATELPYSYSEITHAHVRAQQTSLMTNFCLSALMADTELGPV